MQRTGWFEVWIPTEAELLSDFQEAADRLSTLPICIATLSLE
jgi:hypothetical protein